VAKSVLVSAGKVLDSVVPQDANIGSTERSVVFYAFCVFLSKLMVKESSHHPCNELREEYRQEASPFGENML